MADRIVVMNSGNIEQIGSPMELYDAPQSLFVAGFIGSPAMNFLTGNVNPDKGVFVSEGGTSIELDGARALSREKIVLGVRPEHVMLGNAGPITLKGTVSLVEPTGADTLLSIDLGTDSILVFLRQRTDLKRGEHVDLSVDPGNLHLFDADSGERLDS